MELASNGEIERLKSCIVELEKKLQEKDMALIKVKAQAFDLLFEKVGKE